MFQGIDGFEGIRRDVIQTFELTGKSYRDLNWGDSSISVPMDTPPHPSQPSKNARIAAKAAWCGIILVAAVIIALLSSSQAGAKIAGIVGGGAIFSVIMWKPEDSVSPETRIKPLEKDAED